MNYVFLRDVQQILKEGKHVQLSKEQKNPNYEYLNIEEIDKYINNLIIRFQTFFGSQNIKFTDFVNDIRQKDLFIDTFKRFISLIPKDLIKQISFFTRFNFF